MGEIEWEEGKTGRESREKREGRRRMKRGGKGVGEGGQNHTHSCKRNWFRSNDRMEAQCLRT